MFELIEIEPGYQYKLPLEYRVKHEDWGLWDHLTAILNGARGRGWTFRSDRVAGEWVIREYS